MISVLIVHKAALNTVLHKTTHTNVLCSTKQTDFNNKVLGIKEKSLGSACRQVPALNLFAIDPAVVYQSDTTCRCGVPPAGRLKRGQDLGRRTVAPLITLSDSISPSQASRPQTSKIHNLFAVHTQKCLHKFL